MKVDDGVVRGILSREAIQIALTLGLLVFVVENESRLRGNSTAATPMGYAIEVLAPGAHGLRPATTGATNPTVDATSVTEGIGFVLDEVVHASIILTTGMSIILTLAALVCYDYSVRFTWEREFRRILVCKGEWFARYGFYGLLLALLLLVGLVSPLWGILAACTVWLVFCHYYFFPRSTLDRLSTRLQPPSQEWINKNIRNVRCFPSGSEHHEQSQPGKLLEELFCDGPRTLLIGIGPKNQDQQSEWRPVEFLQRCDPIVASNDSSRLWLVWCDDRDAFEYAVETLEDKPAGLTEALEESGALALIISAGTKCQVIGRIRSRRPTRGELEMAVERADAL